MRYEIVILIIVLSLFAVARAESGGHSERPETPNILLITADDLGYDDLAVHNNPVVSTPHLDELAAQSVRFSDFTVTPVCATTRATLLTGRHFYKAGVSGVHGGRDYLNLDETLISDHLQKKGYATGMWGKWHTGKSEGYYPWNRGFDQAYYAELYQHKNTYGFFNGKKIQHTKWVSEVVTDYAIDFIKQNRHKPFFAYVSYLAPHEPWGAPKRFVQPYTKSGFRPAVANLYGMISEMDYHIGRLLEFIEHSGLADNTLVMFMSDNGPWWDSSNHGAMTLKEWIQRNPNNMFGNKGQTWQNGIRSPLFVKMGKHFPPNTVERYVDIADITPTLLDLTNTVPSSQQTAMDGQSFVPFLKGQIGGENNRVTYIGSHDVVSNKPLFNQWTPIDKTARANMHFGLQIIGLRSEQYKLLLNPALDRAGYPQSIDDYLLFDMQKDPFERHNLYQQLPLVANLMRDKLKLEFSDLLNSVYSYKPPVYLIGGTEPMSVVNGFGPSSTSGNTLVKAHVLSGMKKPGDRAEYDLKILEPNRYTVYVKQRNTDAAGLTFSLRLQDNIIHSEFDGSLIQQIGVMTLKQGINKLSLELTGNNSIKPWAQISGLRRIFFVPPHSDVHPSHYPLPN